MILLTTVLFSLFTFPSQLLLLTLVEGLLIGTDGGMDEKGIDGLMDRAMDGLMDGGMDGVGVDENGMDGMQHRGSWDGLLLDLVSIFLSRPKVRWGEVILRWKLRSLLTSGLLIPTMPNKSSSPTIFSCLAVLTFNLAAKICLYCCNSAAMRIWNSCCCCFRSGDWILASIFCSCCWVLLLDVFC